MNNLLRNKFSAFFCLLLLLGFVACKDDDGENKKEEKKIVYNIEKKFKTKILYAVDNNEEKREEWSYDEQGREIAYIQYEDGMQIQKHVDYEYIEVYDEISLTYSQEYFMNGETEIPYYTKKITKIYSDTTYARLLSEIESDQSQVKRTEYSYDEFGRENGVIVYENGEKIKEYKEYSYSNNECIFYESYLSGDSWVTRKNKKVFLDDAFSVMSSFIVYRSNSSEEYEKTIYTYNSEGRKSGEDYYYRGELERSLRNFEYAGKTLTYVEKDFDLETTKKNKVIFY